MRVRTLATMIAGLCLTGALPGAGWSATSATRALRLEGIDYAAARRAILRQGWRPVSGDCNAAAAQTCRTFPEIGSCSGVDPGPCGMVFAQRRRCLYVGTTGGDPGDPGSDARIQSVKFRQGPCAKY